MTLLGCRGWMLTSPLMKMMMMVALENVENGGVCSSTSSTRAKHLAAIDTTLLLLPSLLLDIFHN